VRPVLNLKLDKDVKAMRAIAEEAFDMVKAYKGSHSGEHGDGLVRSEFHEKMFGRRMVKAFEEVKDRFDPGALLNPGQDRARAEDGRPPTVPLRPRLPRSAYGDRARLVGMAGRRRRFPGRRRDVQQQWRLPRARGAVMCPSYRVTKNERDVTRGRANTLRLAISGQLGMDAFTSDEMAETMKLCVSCKACRRECPTGVDMARMKIEVQAARAKAGRLTLRDRLIAYLPRYAPWAARLRTLVNLRDRLPGLAWLSERAVGFSARRPLPVWQKPFRPPEPASGPADGPEVALFADTFNTYFEPDNLRAAVAVLTAAGYRVHVLQPPDGETRPLCCGRTFLTAGLVEHARREARRLVAAARPFVARGVPILGLEPSCIFTLRDELGAMLPGEEAATTIAGQGLLLEEFLAREAEAGRLKLALRPIPGQAYLHGHCHQKSFGVMGAVEKVLRLVPGLTVRTFASSCCGMAGPFGYQAETFEVSMKMGELSLLPAIRKAEDDAILVADGTSCRQQIADGTGRRALHVARVLEMALEATEGAVTSA
jgi:Fe-S oxidoreductase